MARHLDTLVELQDVLVRLADARERHASVPEPVAELQRESAELEAGIARLQEAIETADQDKRSAEGSAADARDKAQKYEAQIPRVTTQKEYGALLSEIDAAKRSQEAADDAALAAIELADTSRGELDALAERHGEVATALAEGLAEWELQRPEIEQTVAQLEQRAEELRQQLTPQVASLFERLVERHGGDPLARIVEIERPGANMWRCAACNYSVRPQVVVQVRAGNDVVLCDTCQRVFYFDE
ncbi:MAG: hypothetical protein DWQ36_24835 [Acidobacteria bacterium]|nr:MAG: hypothetical protein DWQ30_10875 [Acidobacteriota bacterium]REJ99563.1 MAG: hypothetical protein DWQ36_24835 [Acidobacteriota bacterium]